ncbi:MAG: hypothetical protein ACRD35_05680 [Candidatus Acidiferrales bacterium]
MTAPAERRVALRHRAPGIVAQHRWGQAPVRDFSLSGLFIADPVNSFPQGTELGFEVLMGNMNIRLRGIVRRIEESVGFAVELLDFRLQPAFQEAPTY